MGKAASKTELLETTYASIIRTESLINHFMLQRTNKEQRTFFIYLSRYKEIVLVSQVLLTKSVCCSIFGLLRSPQYQQLRFYELPTIDWQRGLLNRSDPLQTQRPRLETISRDLCVYRRLRTLDNCLKSGPIRVAFIPRQRHLVNRTYQFSYSTRPLRSLAKLAFP